MGQCNTLDTQSGYQCLFLFWLSRTAGPWLARKSPLFVLRPTLLWLESDIMLLIIDIKSHINWTSPLCLYMKCTFRGAVKLRTLSLLEFSCSGDENGNHGFFTCYVPWEAIYLEIYQRKLSPKIIHKMKLRPYACSFVFFLLDSFPSSSIQYPG